MDKLILTDEDLINHLTKHQVSRELRNNIRQFIDDYQLIIPTAYSRRTIFDNLTVTICYLHDIDKVINIFKQFTTTLYFRDNFYHIIRDLIQYGMPVYQYSTIQYHLINICLDYMAVTDNPQKYKFMTNLYTDRLMINSTRGRIDNFEELITRFVNIINKMYIPYFNHLACVKKPKFQLIYKAMRLPILEVRDSYIDFGTTYPCENLLDDQLAIKIWRTTTKYSEMKALQFYKFKNIDYQQEADEILTKMQAYRCLLNIKKAN